MTRDGRVLRSERRVSQVPGELRITVPMDEHARLGEGLGRPAADLQPPTGEGDATAPRDTGTLERRRHSMQRCRTLLREHAGTDHLGVDGVHDGERAPTGARPIADQTPGLELLGGPAVDERRRRSDRQGGGEREDAEILLGLTTEPVEPAADERGQPPQWQGCHQAPAVRTRADTAHLLRVAEQLLDGDGIATGHAPDLVDQLRLGETPEQLAHQFSGGTAVEGRDRNPTPGRLLPPRPQLWVRRSLRRDRRDDPAPWLVLERVEAGHVEPRQALCVVDQDEELLVALRHIQRAGRHRALPGRLRQVNGPEVSASELGQHPGLTDPGLAAQDHRLGPRELDLDPLQQTLPADGALSATTGTPALFRAVIGRGEGHHGVPLLVASPPADMRRAMPPAVQQAPAVAGSRWVVPRRGRMGGDLSVASRQEHLHRGDHAPNPMWMASPVFRHQRAAPAGAAEPCVEDTV